MLLRAATLVALVALVGPGGCPGAPTPPLVPLEVSGHSTALPAGARAMRKDGSRTIVQWGPLDAAATRCGVSEQATVDDALDPAIGGMILDGVVMCGQANPLAGGSSDGECPQVTACVARRGLRSISCTSTSDACRDVAEAFVAAGR